MKDIIQTLRDYEVIRDDDNLQHKVVEGMKPEFAEMSAIPKLDNALADRLTDLDVRKLYKHQAEAIKHAMAGKNIVLEAPTASGKTLAYAIPVLQSLVTAQRGHALLVYPMKAVASDQRKKIHQAIEGLTRPDGTALTCHTYDGDLGQSHRNAIRKERPGILMTNVEFLHRSFLGNSEKWVKFLEDLRWVVVDEMHEYRGYFGTNSAMVLRRLVHHLKERGSNPQFFLASATCENPADHANELTSHDFQLVRSQRDLRPKRRYIFIDPRLDPNNGEQELELRAPKTCSALYELGKSAIIFCPSRRFAETAYQSAINEFDRHQIDTALLRVYKSGMTTDDRQSTLRDLELGHAKYVFTTNALELGIDIASLDSVVMAGFPDNVMSARQQIGRAGRSFDDEGTVIFLAGGNRHDRFHARRLSEFLELRANALVTDLGNPVIAKEHAECIWYETGTPDPSRSLDHLGPGMVDQIAEILRRSGQPKNFGIGGYRPHFSMNLRGSGGQSFDLIHDGDNVGTISERERFRDGHPGSIYFHSGVRYRVVEAPTNTSRTAVRLERESDNHRTLTMTHSEIRAQKIFKVIDIGGGSRGFWIDADVREWIDEVREISVASGKEVKRWTLDDPYRSYRRSGHTTGLQIGSPEVDEVVLRSIEHIFRVGVCTVIPIDQRDFFTMADPKRQEIYAVESHPGGIGIAARIFDRWREILRQGMKIAQDCDCTSSEGCPYCIVPPRRHDEMNKAAGLELAERLLALAG